MQVNIRIWLLLLIAACLGVFSPFVYATTYKGMLYKVSRADEANQNAEIYVWGVAHEIAIASNYQTTKKLNQIFMQNNLYMTESNFSQKKSSEKGAFSKSILLPEGTTLRNVLNDDAYAVFQEKFRRLGFPDVMIAEFEKLRPEVLASANTFSEAEVQESNKYKRGFDEILGAQQIANKKNISYLESLGESLDLFETTCPGKADVSMLLIDKFDLQKHTRQAAYANALMPLVAEGNFRELNALTTKMHTELRSEEIEYRCSVVPRNKMWAQKIKTLKTTDMPVLITVGAFHLLGEDSLIELLKKDGYKVEFIEQEE